MSHLPKRSEEPIQPIEKELMLDTDAPPEKWGPSQEGVSDYKPPLDEIEKGLLEEGAQNPIKKVLMYENQGESDRAHRLKVEGRLGLQEDKKFIKEVRQQGIDLKEEYEKSGQVHKPLEGVEYHVKGRQRHNPPL